VEMFIALAIQSSSKPSSVGLSFTITSISADVGVQVYYQIFG
jgi:hypothetical protein